jgi:hypothetical protein
LNQQDSSVFRVPQNSNYVRSKYKQLPAIHTQGNQINAGDTSKMEDNPLYGALLISILFALILLPYWWLAVQWSATLIQDSPTQFTFTSTTFLLVLAIIDSAFLIRYYQIRQKNQLASAILEIHKGAENYRLLIENAPFPIILTNQMIIPSLS